MRIRKQRHVVDGRDAYETGAAVSGGRMQIPRSRGAASGFLLVALGIWGALIPFVGPSFDFAYGPDGGAWTLARFWLEVLPGIAAVAGGLLLLTSRNRATAMLGGWLAVLAGAWFVVGRAFAEPLALGDPGTPVATTATKQMWLELAYFSGLGAVIVLLGGLAVGRLSVRSLRDVRYAHRPVATHAPAAAVIDDKPNYRVDRRSDYRADETAHPMRPVTEPQPVPVSAATGPQAVAHPRRHRGLSNLFRRGNSRTFAAR